MGILYTALATALLLSTAQDLHTAGHSLLPSLARLAQYTWAVLLPHLICLVQYAYLLAQSYGPPLGWWSLEKSLVMAKSIWAWSKLPWTA